MREDWMCNEDDEFVQQSRPRLLTTNGFLLDSEKPRLQDWSHTPGVIYGDGAVLALMAARHMDGLVLQHVLNHWGLPRARLAWMLVKEESLRPHLELIDFSTEVHVANCFMC